MQHDVIISSSFRGDMYKLKCLLSAHFVSIKDGFLLSLHNPIITSRWYQFIFLDQAINKYICMRFLAALLEKYVILSKKTRISV